MQRIGIVDLGSNTARLVVYDYEPGQFFRLTDEIRELVRLGEGLATDNRLHDDAIERALAVLRMYDDFCRARGVDHMEIVATSAVRDAENGREFLARVCDRGLDIRVLQGDDEARLGVLAAANSFALEHAWVMDLGGGSAQISLMKHRRFAAGHAYPLGAVRLTEQFLRHDPPRKGEVRALESAARRHLAPVLKQMRQSGLPLIAMGGSVRNLAVAVQRATGYPVDQVHNYFMPTADFEALVERLLGMSGSERMRVSGIREDRGDIILAGALVYRQVLREAGLDGVILSREGLRQGEFYRHFLPAPHLLEDVRAFTMRNLFAHYPQPIAHTQQVRFLSRRIFDALQPVHGYGEPEARLLDEAALLHDIGMSVNYYDHHRHSAYLVNASTLAGMTHREQILLSLLVRYHRKGSPGFDGNGALMQPGDDVLLRQLTACVRLAAYLERSRSGRVTDVDIEVHADQVVLHLCATEEPAVERWEAQRQATLFRSAFARELVIDPGYD